MDNQKSFVVGAYACEVTVVDDHESPGFAAGGCEEWDAIRITEPCGRVYGAGEASSLHDEDALHFRVDELTPHQLGAEGERIAGVYLELAGYTVLERNWLCLCGEADLIALDPEGVCVLVEVKTRLSTGRGIPPLPELAVDARKRERYRRIASCYVDLTGFEKVRVDVLAITISLDCHAQVRHLVSAVGGGL